MSGAGRPAVDDALADDHALLVAAVREAGALALGYFRTGVTQWEKKPGDPVSEADHAVDDFLRRELGAARPAYGWLSEESEDGPTRLERSHVWVVDPIDGTRAFLKGRPEFTVAAALVVEGAPCLGVVFNPATGELFEARAGGGGRLNGRAIRVAEPGDGPLRLLASRRTFEKHRWLTELPDTVFQAVNSIAYRLSLVACGRYHATVSLSAKSDWDLAAAQLIVTEAGGRMSDATGRPFVYNRPAPRHASVLAAHPALHAKLLALTAEAGG